MARSLSARFVPCATVLLVSSIAWATAAQNQRSEPPAFASIEGVVRDKATGRPINGATVSCCRVVKTLNFQSPQIVHPLNQTTTDADGHFLLDNIEPGRLPVAVSKDGYDISSMPFKLAPGEKIQNAEFQLSTYGTITGRVSDSNGQPISDAVVALLHYSYLNGSRILTYTGASYRDPVRTNDRGEYRAFNLSPGEYIIRIYAPPPPLNIPFGPTRELTPVLGTVLYPGEIDPSKAEPIIVRSGEEIQLRPVILKPTQLGWIRVHLINGTGGPLPGRGDIVGIIDSHTLPGWESFLLAGDYRGADTAELHEFRPEVLGTYKIVLGWTTRSGVRIQGATSVEYNGKETDINLTLKTQKEPWSGRVVIEDQAVGSPQPLAGVVVNSYSPTGMDGTFISRDSGGDTNSIYRVTGLPSDAYVVSARQGDRDILSGDALSSLISDDGPPIEVLVNSQGGVIQGKVTDRRGRIVHNAIVALIPEGSLKQRADKADTYRSTETDQNGEYEFRGVIPGSFKLYAWSNIPASAYLSSEFIKPFEERGISEQVEKARHITVDLNVLDEAAN